VKYVTLFGFSLNSPGRSGLVGRARGALDEQTLVTDGLDEVSFGPLGRDMIAMHRLETAPRRGTTLVMRRSLDGLMEAKSWIRVLSGSPTTPG
jgi:hypothetical protein